MFEGLSSDAVVSLDQRGEQFVTSVTLYDLIPLIYPQKYLQNRLVSDWYNEKLQSLKCADLLIAISNSSRIEAIEHLSFPASRVHNISADVAPIFQQLDLNAAKTAELRTRYNLKHDFVMYTGGIDHRKNIEGLIRSYALLPASLRQKHQLAVVCSVGKSDIERLRSLADTAGLKPEELVLTGFVPEADLVALYNLCTLFVFPSWHEGFGLPVLEAMRCGAPVIGAKGSSLSEIIQDENALFDAHSDSDIAAKMLKGLTEPAFRQRLLRNGKKQSRRFDWDKSASLAIAAMENAVSERKKLVPTADAGRPKMAFVSPLPPLPSGISDYSAELLPALSAHYDIEVIVAQDKVSDEWVKKNLPVRSLDWFRRNARRYDRIVYHFGNSEYHNHMFELLEKFPGVVVLHDFFLSGVLHHMQHFGFAQGSFLEALKVSHGYGSLAGLQIENAIWRYPCNFAVVSNSKGIIVHSRHSHQLAYQWYGNAAGSWRVLPLLRRPRKLDTREASRESLGIGRDDFVVCSFGMMGKTKQNARLVRAWLESALSQGEECRLVFVGQDAGGEYGAEIRQLLEGERAKKSIVITGRVSEQEYDQYLAAGDLAVQLRTMSRGETSAAVLDCMNAGLPTIANAHGSMSEIDPSAVLFLPDQFSDAQLAQAMEVLWEDKLRRKKLAIQAQAIIRQFHDPVSCAEKYAMEIENFYANAKHDIDDAINEISSIERLCPSEEDLTSVSDALAGSFPRKTRLRQLLVDISELAQRDSKSGIQRVVKSILREWLLHPPVGWQVEPVYATNETSYRYAREFTLKFLGIENFKMKDEVIDFAEGDVFCACDLQHHVQIAHADFFRRLQERGVSVWFVVYDLLPVLESSAFHPGAKELHTRWLEVAAASDGVACISKSVAREFRTWVKENSKDSNNICKVDYFHLGADIRASAPTMGVPSSAEGTLRQLENGTTFLMVGTLEPRKGHQQVLDAFDILWSEGKDINLVMVGKQGWLVEGLISRLTSHPALNRKLFWLEGISDEYLEKIYGASTCLIAASTAEGFGLPLIEAAQHGLPIIARDIPVFREVAGRNAFYFDGDGPEEIAKAISRWLTLHRTGKHPLSAAMQYHSWKESAQRLLEIVGVEPAPVNTTHSLGS